MRRRTIFHTPGLFPILLMIPFLLIAFHNAFASSISFDQPINNQVITNSTVILSGTFLDTANQTYLSSHGVSLTNSISLTIDGNGYSVNALNNQWSVTATSISDGPHKAIVTLTDNTGQYAKDEVDFITITSKFTPSRFNLIELLPDKSCQLLLAHHIPSQCPTLGELAKFDTTNQTYSGKVIEKSDGTWIRTAPEVKQFWQFWKGLNTNIVCAGCDVDFQYADAFKIIWFTPHNFTYTQINYSAPRTIDQTYWNGTKYLTRQIADPSIQSANTKSWNRYVSDDCMTANEVFSPQMLADTIYYMDSGCHANSTKIINTATLVHVLPVIDYEHSHAIQLQNYITGVNPAQNCITNTCAQVSNPDSNQGFYNMAPNAPRKHVNP